MATTGSPKDKKRETVIEFENDPERIRQIMLSVGGQIGSVHFHKRKTGELRKMSYKLHVTKPSVAKAPSGNDGGKRKAVDSKNKQMTVFDVNKVVRDKDGGIVGRGAYRCVPLENVIQITVKGKVYKIKGN